MGLVLELLALREFGKSEGKHQSAWNGLEQLEVDLGYVEARNSTTYQRVLLGAIEADRLKEVACLWGWDGSSV